LELLRTISIFSNPMRWRIRDKHDHLARVLPPVHVESLRKGSSDCLRAISTTTRVERTQVAVDLTNVGREAKVLGDVGVVLGRVIAKGDEAYTEVFSTLKLAALEDVCADLLDVAGRGGDVAALATCAILDEDEIAAGGE